MNNVDATLPLTINWILDGDNTQIPFTVNDPQVTQIELDDDITVISHFTINRVVFKDSGKYGCYVFNRKEVQPVSANATVTVFCKHLLTVFPPNQC